MNKFLLSILLLMLPACSLFAEKDLEKIADEITKEGKTLYKIDMASWYGTDVMQAKYEGNIDNIGGYFSYLDDDDKRICIFYSKDNFHKIVFQVTFDSTYKMDRAIASTEVRPFNAKEQELYNMREKAKEHASNDTLFKIYKNTTYNLIPLIYNGERKVYIITGTTENDIVPLGNDYLIGFNKNLDIQKVTKIHRSFIPIENPADKQTDITTVHSHLSTTGDFITPTDICTIMEYEKMKHWQSHIVISEDYISLWSCEKDDLVILTKKAWEAIMKDQEKRHPENK